MSAEKGPENNSQDSNEPTVIGSFSPEPASRIATEETKKDLGTGDTAELKNPEPVENGKDKVGETDWEKSIREKKAQGKPITKAEERYLAQREKEEPKPKAAPEAVKEKPVEVPPVVETKDQHVEAQTVPEALVPPEAPVKKLSPEEQAKKKIEAEYSKEKEEKIIKKGVEQRLSDPKYISACEGNIRNELLARTDLSKNEIDSLVYDNKFAVKGLGQKIDIRDVIGLVAEGMSPKDIRNVKRSFFLGKTTIPNHPELSSEDFDKLVEGNIRARIEKIAKKEVVQEWERRKKEWIDAESLKIKAQQAEAEAKEKIKKEAEEKTKIKETEKLTKIEIAQQIPDKERSKYLREFRDKWNEAILRFSKIKEINKVLEKGEKTGEYKIKGVKGLTPEEAKAKIEEFKKELEGKNTKRSDEIVDIMNTVTGRSLKKEAKKIAAEKQENGMDLVWLTKEVQKIYKEQAGQLGKKGKAPVTTKAALIMPTTIEEVSAPALDETPEQSKTEKPEEKNIIENYNPGDEIIVEESFVDVGSDTIRQVKKGKFIGVKEVEGEKVVVVDTDLGGGKIYTRRIPVGLFLRLQK